MNGWLASACGFPVRHVPCPHPALRVDATVAAAGVMHTTESDTLEGPLAKFKSIDAPHFLVGADTHGKVAILQLIPLGWAAAALMHVGNPPTNGWARAQIEVVARANEHPYSFTPGTLNALEHLLAALQHVQGIPLTRPFQDTMPPAPWATPTFARRNAGKWGKVAGWYGHVEIPENDHWDPGALAWTPLLNRAHAIAAGQPNGHPAPRAIPQPKAVPGAVKARLRPLPARTGVKPLSPGQAAMRLK